MGDDYSRKAINRGTATDSRKYGSSGSLSSLVHDEYKNTEKGKGKQDVKQVVDTPHVEGLAGRRKSLGVHRHRKTRRPSSMAQMVQCGNKGCFP